MWRNCRRQVFRWYRKIYGTKSGFTRGEKISASLQAAGVAVFFGLFFYKSFKVIPFMLPIGIFYLTMLEKKKEKRKKEQLRNEFRDAILSVAANLRAGYAVENAFRETLQEMKILHGKESLIYQEFYKIMQGLANGISIETLTEQFAQRTGLEEIREFADVFHIAKRSSGNLTEIIYETAGMIGEKIEVEREVQVLISAKRLEQNIMSVIPFVIICYVSAASGGYFNPLYTTSAGKAVMTVCLVIYVTAYMLGRKITEILV